MCGLVGYWVSDGFNYEALVPRFDKASEAIAHRGPDDQGVWAHEGHQLRLGHRRLSIIDLSSSGKQPMHCAESKNTLVFNGEIYNYLELRADLEQRGAQFRTHSDTEAILKGIAIDGPDFINKLRGMFAFAYWDEVNKRLLLARDRAGKKPLYYSSCPEGIYFASEIGALSHLIPDSAKEIDRNAIDQYLSLGSVPGEMTVYSGIRELKPGHVSILENPRQFQQKQYWKVNWQAQNNLDFEQAVEQCDQLIQDSIKIRLRADVPIGIFLSGGIDSSLVTAIAAQLQSTPLQTMCIGFRDGSFDERDLARSVADRYGTNHEGILLEPDIESSLPKIISAYGEPFADASAIPSWFVSEYASRSLKVVLNGDGGDELFCGYRRHQAARYLGLVQQLLSRPLSRKMGQALLACLPAPRVARSHYAFVYRMIRGIASEPAKASLVFSSDGFTVNEKRQLYRDRGPVVGTGMLTDNLQSLIDMDPLQQMIAMDFEESLPDDLLVKMDIATMSHHLEARSPLLDQELIEFAFSLPTSVRLRGMQTKPVLRALAEKYLPDSVVNAPKRGFEIPLTNWLQSDLKQMSHDYLLSGSDLIADMFQHSYISKLLQGPTQNAMDPGRWGQLVWNLLVLAIWDTERRKLQ